METGALTWMVSRGPVKVGDIAGCVHKTRADRPYWQIKIDQRLYPSHCIIWLWMTGSWPNHEIDHKDVDGTNNAWSNLRLATPRQNKANTKIRKNNTSGYRGVTFDKSRGKWQAKISHFGKTINLGRFGAKEDAVSAYEAAALEAFGEFKRAA